jgi:hypothetical protein
LKSGERKKVDRRLRKTVKRSIGETGMRRRKKNRAAERVLIEIRAPVAEPISAKISFYIFKNNKINKIDALPISRITGTEK